MDHKFYPGQKVRRTLPNGKFKAGDVVTIDKFNSPHFFNVKEDPNGPEHCIDNCEPVQSSYDDIVKQKDESKAADLAYENPLVGTKYDSNKAPMDLIPYESLEEIAKVLGQGEKKYGTANWANGIEMRRLLAAAMRHIGQFNDGEDYDEETKTLHIANAATNLIFAIWMYKNRPDMDNRWVLNINKLSESDIMVVSEELQKRGR